MPEPPRLNRAREVKRVAEFNADTPIGTKVNVWRTTRLDDLKCVAPTRTKAFLATDGTAVIFLEGIAGYWSLDAITRYQEVA